MDIAIVTGAETPLGLRIVQHLVRQGCCVHGIGNNFSRVTYADTGAVRQAAADILEREGRLHVLVHAVDVTPGAAFAQLPVGNLEAVLKIGLVGPALLTRLVWPNLLRFRGQLIQIISANKSGHPSSAVNALVEGALRRMNEALAEDARQAGARVTNLILRQNPEADPDADPPQERQSRIDPEHVLRTIDYLLDVNAANVPEAITLRPRLAPGAEGPLPETAAPLDPYQVVSLPPGEYFPPKQEKIPTEKRQVIDRTIPYSDEELEDRIHAAIEDYEAQPEEPEGGGKPRKQTGGQPAPAETETGGENGKRRRGRRRGGRNRKRKGGESGAHGEKTGEGSGREGTAPDEPRQSPDPTEPEAEKPPAPEPPQGSGDAPEPKATAEPPAKKKAKKKSAKKTAAKKSAKKKTATQQSAKKTPKKKAKKAANQKASRKTEDGPGNPP